MKKKAQVTIFIIIGVIILLTTITIIYITKEKAEEVTPETEIAEEIPTELDPIKSYVETCIGEVLTEGIKIVEEHGGYIYQYSFDVNADPTEGNAIEFSPDTGIYVPYWYYMESDNYCTENCEFTADMMPQLCKLNRNCITTAVNLDDNSIEKQLDDYITANLRDCLDDFKPFREQGINIIELGNIEADTIIKDKEITVIVGYPLRIEKQDTTSEMTRFTKSIYSDLAEMYEIAYDIVDYEMQNCFIGDHVRNYYSYYMGLDENDLPPISEMTVGTDSITEWNMEDVETNLKTKTVNAMYMLGIFNTSGFVWPTVPQDTDYYETSQGVYDQFVFFPLRRYHAATVNIFYFNWWDPYLDVKPNEGNMLRPEELSGSGLLGIAGSLLKTKTYEFFYQYSFPVVVEIRKRDNVNREHIFRFALEENIRANRCFNADAELIHATSVAQTILCDQDQLVNEISITVKDEDNNPLEDVAVSFFAGQSCLLGVTDSDGKLDTSYPETFGGFLKLEKEDYVTKLVKEQDLGATLDTELQEFKHFSATVKKYVMTSPNVCCGAAEDLNETEQVIINLEKVTDPNNPLEQELKQPMVFVGSDVDTLTWDVKLIPGKYKIDATYIDNEEYTTEARCIKYCSDYDELENECDDYGYAPDEPQSTKPFGGALLNETIGYWQISESNFEGKNKVEFYVLRVPDANCISTHDCILSPCIGLEEMDKVDDYSENFRSYLLPKFKE